MAMPDSIRHHDASYKNDEQGYDHFHYASPPSLGYSAMPPKINRMLMIPIDTRPNQGSFSKK
jgi:hypothetical protein